MCHKMYKDHKHKEKQLSSWFSAKEKVKREKTLEDKGST